MIRGHIETPGLSTKGDKIFVSVILGLVIFAIVGGIIGTFLFLHELAKLLTGIN